MYRELKNESVVMRIADGASVPVDHPTYIKWLADGNTPEPYVEPPETVPAEITMRQARLGLLNLGKLGDIDSAVNGMGESAVIEWGYAQSVKRSHPIVIDLLPLLGLSDSEIDELFISSSKL